MTAVNITAAWQEVTLSVPSVISVGHGPCWIAPSGTVNPNSGVQFHGSEYFPAGTIAVRGPCVFTHEAWNDPMSPSMFASDGWSVADAVASGKATVTITTLPDLGGFNIVSIDWSNDAGATWTSLTRTTAGTEDITTASATIVLRATTVQGSGIKSAGKAVVVA